MDINIALLPGDGIGPEIIAEATKVLDRTAAKFGHRIRYTEALVGAAAIDATGNPYPDTTHCICREADAVLFGAIGDPKYDNNPKAKVRPEQGLLRMRKALGLFANLRPVALFDALADRSPLKAEVVRGTDFICVRELTGGIYFGRPQGRDEEGARAFDTCTYTVSEIERVLHVAFRLAVSRRRKLTVVDKANVLETSRLWRETAQRVAREYPEVAVDYMFVDMPPGTGDVALNVFQTLPVDGVIIVASPQDLVSMVVQKAVKMAQMMHIPIVGLVENMSYVQCPDCGKKLYIFGEGKTEEAAREYGLPLLAKMPIDPQLAKLTDDGCIEQFEGHWLDGVVDAILKK